MTLSLRIGFSFGFPVPGILKKLCIFHHGKAIPGVNQKKKKKKKKKQKKMKIFEKKVENFFWPKTVFRRVCRLFEQKRTFEIFLKKTFLSSDFFQMPFFKNRFFLILLVLGEA